MANLNNKKHIFFVTSPRSPMKMLNEIKFLTQNYSNQKWDKKTQTDFYSNLAEQDFFQGSKKGELDFKARDRINRGPKALGFVNLSPSIELTEAGKNFINGKRPEEILLKQLLKFQLPSPYHKQKNSNFKIKPYLELLRLIHELDGLKKIEIAIFVIQLINIKDYEVIKNKILRFRNDLKTLDRQKTSYNKFVYETAEIEISNLYKSEINSGELKIRENKDIDKTKFIRKKFSNFKDYADAAMRYLRATSLVVYNAKNGKLQINNTKITDLEYILKTVKKEPKEFSDTEEFKTYLFDAKTPSLPLDNEEELINKILELPNNTYSTTSLETFSIEHLKDTFNDLKESHDKQSLNRQIEELMSYKYHDDIQEIFNKIKQKELLEPPLFLEWNVWRGMVMLDDGEIHGNFKLDDNGLPLYTAPGNQPDILCTYKDFDVLVEVTMSSGQKQYEMEGEPVPRHLGKHLKNSKKDAYCLFIAPKLNDATIAHFFALHKINISYYGGKARIIPVNLDSFIRILLHAYKSQKKPTSKNIHEFVQFASLKAEELDNEVDWINTINQSIDKIFAITD